MGKYGSLTRPQKKISGENFCQSELVTVRKYTHFKAWGFRETAYANCATYSRHGGLERQLMKIVLHIQDMNLDFFREKEKKSHLGVFNIYLYIYIYIFLLSKYFLLENKLYDVS